MRLSFELVAHWWQALALMQIRNSCREGMTSMTEEITVGQQRRFYTETILQDRVRCYLLTDDEEPIGYGLLRPDPDYRKVWMTAGLIPERRGGGLSRTLIALITEIAYQAPDVQVWIDVYDDNLALRGDIRNGYVFVRSEVRNGKLLHVMRHRRDRVLGPVELGRLEMERQGLRTEIEEVDAIHRESYRQ